MARLTRDDLLEHLAEQVEILRDLAAGYDAGRTHLAKPLSAAIRTLVHVTGGERGSAGLLHQLGSLDAMSFLDSGGELVAEPSMLPFSPLTLVRLSDEGSGFIALCEVGGEKPRILASPGAQARHLLEHGRKISQPGTWHPFSVWRDELGILMTDHDGRRYSRAKIVLAVANKEGGTHVDGRQPGWMRELLRSNAVGGVFRGADDEELISSPVLPVVRQVAYELDSSISAVFEQFRP